MVSGSGRNATCCKELNLPSDGRRKGLSLDNKVSLIVHSHFERWIKASLEQFDTMSAGKLVNVG